MPHPPKTLVQRLHYNQTAWIYRYTLFLRFSPRCTTSMPSFNVLIDMPGGIAVMMGNKVYNWMLAESITELFVVCSMHTKSLHIKIRTILLA